MGNAGGDLEAFMGAVKRGDAGRVRELAGGDAGLVHARDNGSFGVTALIHAVWHDHREIVDLLLELGADIDQRSEWWAGSFGALDHGTAEMGEYLLSRGATLMAHAAARLGKADELRAMIRADPGVVHERGGDGQMPLHFSRGAGIVDLLLDAGAEIDATDLDHVSTAAQWRCTDRADVSARLVERGAAADPFMAVRLGDVALLERLLADEAEGVDVRVTGERFPAPEPAAGHIYMFTIGGGCTLLHAAGGAGHADVARWLIGRGAELSARGGYDDGTPLHQAAWNDHPEVISALVEGGADLDLPSGSMHENQPLGWAIVSGASGAVRRLLELGAPVHEHHREEAGAGARGAFRELNRERRLEAWRDVAGLIEGVSMRGRREDD